MKDHLALSGISVDLDGQRVVESIDFSLEHGQIGSLLGPSGCGKTTLLRTIAGFERPGEGEIRSGGKLIASYGYSLAPEHRNIGMVFQDFALFPHLSVAGNVGFGIRHRTARQRADRVDELLALVGLSEYRDSYPHQLSGGQQQRVALTRAIAPLQRCYCWTSRSAAKISNCVSSWCSRSAKCCAVTALLHCW